MILRNHAAALQRLHVKAPSSHEVIGQLSGLQLGGDFHEWQEGTSQRRDERLGLRTEHQLRVGDRMWIQNASGQIREIQGIAARRQITEDFIDSGEFLSHAEDVRFLERATLRDGRQVYRLEIQPRGGEPYIVGIDATNWLVDEKSFVDNDSVQEIYYTDYRVVDGLLIPYKEVDSTGTNDAYDITATVDKVIVDQPIAASVFAPLSPLGVDEHGPVTVPVELHQGLPFIVVSIGGHKYHFLVDSGSQGDVIDPSVASDLGLHPEGTVEIEGARRTRGIGAVELPPVSIGSAVFTSQLATVFDLGKIPSGTVKLDGVLGGPFFSAAELRFDPDRSTLTIAPPGSLPSVGEKISVDTDRELVEINGRVDREADTRLIVDTGSSAELLIYTSFLKAHPSVVSTLGSKPVYNQGAGGSTTAVGTVVDELQIGSYHLFNRRTDVILSTVGAFGDRIDGGNVGFPTLHNFVTTFDLANRAMYLSRAGTYDDGHDRPRTENINPNIP